MCVYIHVYLKRLCVLSKRHLSLRVCDPKIFVCVCVCECLGNGEKQQNAQAKADVGTHAAVRRSFRLVDVRVCRVEHKYTRL